MLDILLDYPKIMKLHPCYDPLIAGQVPADRPEFWLSELLDYAVVADYDRIWVATRVLDTLTLRKFSYWCLARLLEKHTNAPVEGAVQSALECAKSMADGEQVETLTALTREKIESEMTKATEKGNPNIVRSFVLRCAYWSIYPTAVASAWYTAYFSTLLIQRFDPARDFRQEQIEFLIGLIRPEGGDAPAPAELP